MNLKNFIHSLKKYDWHIKKGQIRSKQEVVHIREYPYTTNGGKLKIDEVEVMCEIECCPLTVEEKYDSFSWELCQKNLKFPNEIAEAVIFASDCSFGALSLLNSNTPEHMKNPVKSYNGDISNLVELRNILLRELNLKEVP